MGLEINSRALATTTTTKEAARVFIEVSEEPIRSTIVREGRAVPVAKVSRARLDDFLGQVVEVPAPRVLRVVGQSVDAGTAVPKGTVVDLTLAAVEDVPVRIVENAHTDLEARNVYEVVSSSALLDEKVVEILTNRERPEDATDEEQQIVTQALGRIGVQVDPADVKRNYAAAHSTARSLLAFKG